MSVLFALILAASPASAPAEPIQAKPRKKCEFISEVGSNRPRRVCQIIQPKAPQEQASETQKSAVDHSQHQKGTPE